MTIGVRLSPSMYWGKVATLEPRRRITSPSTSSVPARMRSTVDLPAPLPPTSPILAPAFTFIPRLARPCLQNFPRNSAQ